jgi:hypothetical protein
MGIGQSLLPEFDHEMANTRKTLERVPDDRFEWTPHAKSFPMGKLATHLANLPTWTNVTIDMDEFDMAPEGVQVKTPECHSQKNYWKRLMPMLQKLERRLRELLTRDLSTVVVACRRTEIVFNAENCGSA